MATQLKQGICFFCLWALYSFVSGQPDDPRQKHYQRNVRPILYEHCFPCHNGEDNKAGINFDNFFFISSIVRRGELFQEIIQQIEHRTMPPDTRAPLSQNEVDTVTHYLNSYLEAALAEKDPGLIPPRRLNNQEYRYVMKDLLGVEVKVDSLFPSDPSGGGGFDNQAGTLYLTPLLIERYYEAAEGIIEGVYKDKDAWRDLVPAYSNSFANTLKVFWYKTIYKRDISLERPLDQASDILFPFATLAYRNFLSQEEKNRIQDFFAEAYLLFEDKEDRFDASIKETMKRILISHNFLYRIESDPKIEEPYPISNFELASRLSFFLWSSIPDQHLLDVAYREDLHNPQVLEREVKRMMQSSKARRLGEQFALQWLELKKLKDPSFQLDAELYPHFTPVLKSLMLKEVELFFNNVLMDSHNLLELIDSEYSFLNEELAQHYGIQGVQGDSMRKVVFASNERGGVLGMAGVLTATSLPTRTSPVLRGKWVLEQILGTPPPPPPPNVPELEASHDSSESEVTLRVLLEKHRSDPACQGCHQAMDPIGLGLENFDAMGRWRTAYGQEPIDPSGVMKSGETFEGPAQLRKILKEQKELFAKNFSQKMLSFALGRGVIFKDSPTVRHLQQKLVESDFNSEIFLMELVKSYPFRYKKSDIKDVPKKARRS